MLKQLFIFSFLFCSCIVFSQTDTTRQRGTIKIGKAKNVEIYIKAIAEYTKYDLSKIKRDVSKNEMYQPFPIVDGYPFPFNYTQYLKSNFKNIEIDLKGKTNDTIVLEVMILANGKIYVKDNSLPITAKGVTANYDDKSGVYELGSLHLHCLDFIKKIKKWFPGYVVFPMKDKYKGEVVIKPNKKNVDVTGAITILFSTIPFEN